MTRMQDNPIHLREKNSNIKLTAPVMIVLFLAETIYGFYSSIVELAMPGDAMSRVAGAYYVLSVKPPRFTSMGLVWNPLVSTLEIPLVALAPLWKPLISRGVAGCIVTAMFAALTAGVLLNTFLKFKVSKLYAVFITLLYSLHPYIFLYGSNGMSESVFFFFLIYCICNLTLWFQFGTSRYMIRIAFGLVGGFLSRYETVPLGVGIGICVILNILFNKREKPYWSARGSKKERYCYIEGTLVMLFTPVVYAGIIWILYCWIITGNPLYFMNSNYANGGQSAFAVGSSTLADLISHVSFRTMPFLVFFFVILLVRIVQGRIFKYDFLCLIILVASVLVFQILMYWKGTSFGWVRYFCYSMPTCMAWLPYEMSTYQTAKVPESTGLQHDERLDLHSSKKGILRLAQVLLPISLIVSTFMIMNVFQDNNIVQQEIGSYAYQDSLVIADYINNKIPDKIILTDVFTTYITAVNVDHFDNLVVTSSPNFKQCVADPVRNGIEYLLIPDPKGVSNYDALNTAYPNIYNKGRDWCVEEAEFGNYKLFRVTG